MRTHIDAAGRVVVPKRLRELLGLEAGGEVEIREHDGVVEIRPVGREVRIGTDSHGLAVLTAAPGVPPLTDDDVLTALADVRQWPRDR